MQKMECQNKGKWEKEKGKANDGVLGIQVEKGSWGGADSPWGQAESLSIVEAGEHWAPLGCLALYELSNHFS